MASCALKQIKKNIKRCGEKSLAKGVDEIVYLGMITAQAIAFTYDATNELLCTGIAMADGEKLFAYEGKNYSNDPSVSMNKTDYDLTLPQQIIITLFSNSAATKAEIMALLTRKDLIVIYKRVQGDFEGMGFHTGMLVTAFTYRPNDDNKGAFLITLSAPDEELLPVTVKHTTAGNLDDTTSYLAGLVTPD
ncbi:hypothetical protein [Spirosoma aerophilum]